MKIDLYPKKEELRGATEAYLLENHDEFFKKFSNPSWISFYNTSLHQPVSFLFLKNLFLDI
jgi:hypothetical protein